MASPEVFQLFVYGSLRSDFKSPAYEYISHFFTFTSNAKVKGKLFDMGNYPAGTPTKENTFIIGELYVAKGKEEFSWGIIRLDDYEGANVESDEMQLFRRELTEVYFDNKTMTHAWIYWYNGDVSSKPVIASGDFIQYIRDKK